MTGIHTELTLLPMTIAKWHPGTGTPMYLFNVPPEIKWQPREDLFMTTLIELTSSHWSSFRGTFCPSSRYDLTGIGYADAALMYELRKLYIESLRRRIDYTLSQLYNQFYSDLDPRWDAMVTLAEDLNLQHDSEQLYRLPQINATIRMYYPSQEHESCADIITVLDGHAMNIIHEAEALLKTQEFWWHWENWLRIAKRPISLEMVDAAIQDAIREQEQRWKWLIIHVRPGLFDA